MPKTMVARHWPRVSLHVCPSIQAMPTPMRPEIRKRMARAVTGGASATMMRADVKADDHMRAKTSPMTIARMSIGLLRCCTPPVFARPPQEGKAARLLLGAGRRFLDRGVIDQVPGQAFVAVDPFAEPRIVAHVVRQPLTHHDTAERAAAGIADGVGEAALAVAEEVARPDRVLLIADDRDRLSLQHVDAFVFVMVDVMFRRLVPRCDLDDVEADAGEAGHVAERLVEALCVAVEEMRLGKARHRLDLVAPQQIGMSGHVALPRGSGRHSRPTRRDATKKGRPADDP